MTRQDKTTVCSGRKVDSVRHEADVLDEEETDALRQCHQQRDIHLNAQVFMVIIFIHSDI